MSDPQANAAQIDYWNANVGKTWAELQDLLDAQIDPLGRVAMAALPLSPDAHVLDIGCGCGQTTYQLAERLGSGGQVTGIDISEPMLAVARNRATTASDVAVRFILADAQTDALGGTQFDAAFSRFGVMFFSDPTAAFSNIRRRLKPGAPLAFVCWRPITENPWMSAPRACLEDLVPTQPVANPTAPGPFAFADPDRVRTILSNAGFSNIRLTPHRANVGVATLEGQVQISLKVGPLGSLLREEPQWRDVATERVSKMLEAYLTPEGVKMPAAVWIVTASA